MKEEKLTEVAVKLNELMYQVGFINNYLSCLGLELSKGDSDMVIYSLKDEKGLDNMTIVLSHLVESIDSCSTSLFEMADSEVTE